MNDEWSQEPVVLDSNQLPVLSSLLHQADDDQSLVPNAQRRALQEELSVFSVKGNLSEGVIPVSAPLGALPLPLTLTLSLVLLDCCRVPLEGRKSDPHEDGTRLLSSFNR